MVNVYETMTKPESKVLSGNKSFSEYGIARQYSPPGRLENGLIHVALVDLYAGNWCYTGNKHTPRLEPNCWGQESRRVT
jgi:hypothetical protein